MRANHLFQFQSKPYISMLEVKVISEFFSLINILKKRKGIINISFANYWFKLRREYSSQRIPFTRKKKFAKVSSTGQRIATQLYGIVSLVISVIK